MYQCFYASDFCNFGVKQRLIRKEDKTIISICKQLSS